jgi:hypothetical protein
VDVAAVVDAGCSEAGVSDSVSFLAYFPAIQSAWKIHGQGDGARVQIEIPENQMGQAIQLLAWRSKVLRLR